RRPCARDDRRWRRSVRRRGPVTAAAAAAALTWCMLRAVLVELRDVRKRYGTVEALRGLGGTIDGDRVGLLGPNGAGKSTLIQLLLGPLPFEGEATVLGHSPRSEAFAIRDRVGYMPETDSYLAGMTAVELCVYAGQLSGLPRGAAMQRAHAALYHVGLEDKRYLNRETYSTRMKQRV